MISRQVFLCRMNLITNMSYKSSPSAFTIIVAFVCLALAGLAFLPLLPVKLSPSRTLPRLSVSFNMPGNSSRVIEMEVTSRLEAMLSRISGVKEISSTSGNGWGRITIELDKHTDVDAARFEASTIVRQTWPDLPDGVTYPTLQMSRPDDKESRPFLTYTLNAAATPIFIQRYAENQIKPRLSTIQGIYRIQVSGATPMEWRLEYDSRQLSELGITVQDIQEAISTYYQKEFLGIANLSNDPDEKHWMRLALIPQHTEEGFDPTKISVKSPQGKLLRLDQLLQVTRQEEEPQSYYRINGLNSIYLSIWAEETANQLQLAQQIKEEMGNIQQNLPAGYEIHTSYDATEYIQEELDKIYVRTGLTILILLLFVLLITRNFRYLFLIVISLSINLCIAVIFYYLFGLEMQLYSLAGITISLSLVIDNTIVMTDHIRRRHDLKAFLSILAATLTTIGALAIIFFLDERIRLNLQDFAAVVIINLAVSLAVALFLVPALIKKMQLASYTVRNAGFIRRGSRMPSFTSTGITAGRSVCCANGRNFPVSYWCWCSACQSSSCRRKSSTTTRNGIRIPTPCVSTPIIHSCKKTCGRRKSSLRSTKDWAEPCASSSRKYMKAVTSPATTKLCSVSRPPCRAEQPWNR